MYLASRVSGARMIFNLGVLVTLAFDDAGEDAAADDVDYDMAAARRYDVR